MGSKNDKLRTYSLGTLLGIVAYAVFAYLDIFMMPTNYETAWMIRGVIIILTIIIWGLIFLKKNVNNINVISVLTIIIGIIGIITIIWNTKAQDPAFYGYYVGLILVLLWSSFIFKHNFKINLYISIFTIILYNITAIFKQELIFSPYDTAKYSWFLGNNFFLFFSAILTTVGSYIIHKHENEIIKINIGLVNEKQELKKAKEQAVESDLLKTEFIRNISHEIRTPLNSLLGFSEFFNNKNISSKDKERYLNYIQDSGKQLTHIIDSILEISKLSTKQIRVEKKAVCLNNLLLKQFNIFEKQAKKQKLKLYFKKALPDTESIIVTDEIILNKILNNLIQNALKFTLQGFIEFGYKLASNSDKKEIEIYVKDTGIGIKPDSQKIIFKSFSQEEKELSKKVSGLGLGLSIIKENIELLESKISLESVKDKGTTFSFIIPYLQPSERH